MMTLGKPLLVITFLLWLFPSIGLVQETMQTADKITELGAIDTTMWKYLSAKDLAGWVITKVDSELALKSYYASGVKLFIDVRDISNKINKGKLTLEQESPRLIGLLEQTKEYFEQALKINPFDALIRTGIAGVYNSLEFLYAKTNDATKHLQMIKNLLCLETDQIKRVDLLNKAGTIYLNHQDWEQAKDNFQSAVDIILEREAAVDTARLFNNLYSRGLAQMKLYEAEPALTSFTYARMIAPDDNFYQRVTSWINFINWDDGNMRASELRRNAIALASEKKYQETEKTFLELLPIIKTEKARNEIELNLAFIQFYNLDEKEEAVDRLWKVVQKFSLDSLTGAPINSSEKEFWERYAQMCITMGDKYFTSNKKLSFTYLLKASQIETSVRGRAFLYLAKLSINNPQICLDYCNRTQSYLGQLNDRDKKLFYEIAYNTYLKRGDFEQALKWFKKYHEI